MAAIFEALEVETTPSREIAVGAVPRPGWKPFFARVGNQRETSLEPSVELPSCKWLAHQLLCRRHP